MIEFLTFILDILDLTVAVFGFLFAIHYIKMPRDPTAKNWCFTWNNYPNGYQDIIQGKLAELETNEQITLTYGVFGEEMGASETPHIQGFVAFDKPLSRPAQKLWQAHWTVARLLTNSIEYCKKDGTFWEIGTQPTKKGKQGEREELTAFRTVVQETFQAGETFTPRMARDQYPHLCAKFSKFVTATIQDFKPKRQVTTHPLHEWQQELNQTLNLPANDRDVIFIVDRRGNRGKSWFAKYYRSLHENVTIIQPGPYREMAYGFSEQSRVVFIDTPRMKTEHFQYHFLEHLKDGMIRSTKYEPVDLEWNHNMHVVVLMNEEPLKDGTLSLDRYVIKYLD